METDDTVDLLEKAKSHPLKASQVARMMGVSPYTVNAWARDGCDGILLDSVLIGKRRKFSEEGVRKFLAETKDRERAVAAVHERMSDGTGAGVKPQPRPTSGTTASKKKRASAARAKLA